MKILYKESFQKRFNRQIAYISADSVENARRFRDALKLKMEKIKTNPYQCRKSIFFNDEKIRDLIYKGYTIVYQINDNSIDVFGLVNLTFGFFNLFQMYDASSFSFRFFIVLSPNL